MRFPAGLPGFLVTPVIVACFGLFLALLVVAVLAGVVWRVGRWILRHPGFVL